MTPRHLCENPEWLCPTMCEMLRDVKCYATSNATRRQMRMFRCMLCEMCQRSQHWIVANVREFYYTKHVRRPPPNQHKGKSQRDVTSKKSPLPEKHKRPFLGSFISKKVRAKISQSLIDLDSFFLVSDVSNNGGHVSKCHVIWGFPTGRAASEFLTLTSTF